MYYTRRVTFVKKHLYFLKRGTKVLGWRNMRRRCLFLFYGTDGTHYYIICTKLCQEEHREQPPIPGGRKPPRSQGDRRPPARETSDYVVTESYTFLVSVLF